MSLAITTPLLSTGDVTPAQVRADIVTQPNRTRYSDAEVDHLIGRLFYWCDLFGFNVLLVAAQIAHETNRLRFTGDVPFGYHNFAGLGATGGVPGHRFDSIDAGILATVAHHAVYRWGHRDNWPTHLRPYAGEHIDPRYDEALAKVREIGRFMIVLGDYRGTWAVPGKTYPESIVRVAGEILRHPKGTPVATPYAHVVPGLVDLRPVLQRNPNGGSEGRIALSQKRGIVIHFNGPDVGANDREHIINVASYHCSKDFSSNGSGAIGDGIMYHLAIADDGIAYLTRDLEAGLWHCGHAWNRHSFAIYVPIGINQRATPVQLRRLAEVCAALLRFTGEGLEAVKGHMELSATNCPGSLMGDFVRPFRAGQLPAGPIVTPPQVVKPVPAVPGAQPDPWRFDEAAKNYAKAWNGGEPFWVLNPFVDWIHANGGLRVMGYVVSGAFYEDGLLVQYFEGGRLEWHPRNPVEHRVLRGHTGLEVIRVRHPERVPA